MEVLTFAIHSVVLCQGGKKFYMGLQRDKKQIVY